jgi:hypothetical protein
MKRYILASLLVGASLSCKEKFIDLQPISDMNAGISIKPSRI